VAQIGAAIGPATSIEVWFQGEMRVGQNKKLTYLWARKGTPDSRID
jgi:hypothetical protein